MLFLLFASCFFLSTVYSDAPTTCPFAPTVCECYSPKLDPHGTVKSFDTVVCNSTELPTLRDVPSGQTYEITFEMLILSDHAFELPSKYFSAFSSILSLEIWQDGMYEASDVDIPTDPPVAQQFAVDAFDGVTVPTLTFYTLTNLLPIPDSLKPLGKNGLVDLTIVNHGPGRLDANALVAFPKLTGFSVTSANLAIDPNAFWGVAGNLKQLKLENVGLTEFPTAALSNMNALNSLTLDANRIATIPEGALGKFPSLKYLSLSLNPLGDAIENGALDNLPQQVTSVFFKNVGLTRMPIEFLSTNPQLTEVHFETNMITKIGANDFSGSPNLNNLLLNDNPIDTIEKGAFQPLKSLRFVSLRNTSINSIDFALFSGLAGTPYDKLVVALSRTSNLKSVEMTWTEKIPASFNIDIDHSNLETISGNFEVIFQKSEVRLDLSYNTNLKCATLDWLAPYAVCSPDMIKMTNSVCADTKMSLADYFKSKLKGPCPTTSIPTTVVTTGQSSQSTTSKGMAHATSAMSLVIACVLIAGLKI